jgi:hypothetical protein
MAYLIYFNNGIDAAFAANTREVIISYPLSSNKCLMIVPVVSVQFSVFLYKLNGFIIRVLSVFRVVLTYFLFKQTTHSTLSI